MTKQQTSLRTTMDLMIETGGEIARVRSPDPEWMFVIVRGHQAQHALNLAIDSYQGIRRGSA